MTPVAEATVGAPIDPHRHGWVVRWVVPLWRPALVLGIGLASGLATSSGSASDMVRLLGLVVVLVVMGDTLIRCLRVSTNVIEALALSAAGGIAILVSLTALVSLFEPASLATPLLAALTLITGALALSPGVSSHRFERSDPTGWALASAISLTPALLYGAIARSPFYLGYDPFTMAAYAQKLVDEPVSPLAFPTVWFNHAEQVASGIYYFTAGAGAISSHSVAGIVRIGGPALLGLVALILFLVVWRAFGTRLGGVVGAVVFVSSPFVMSRYVMYIRENVALVFFLALVLLLVSTKPPLPRGTLVFAALLTGVTVQTHEFVAVLVVATWGVFFATSLLSHRRGSDTVRDILTVGVLSAVFALPFAVPVFGQFVPLFVSNQTAGITGSLNPEDAANYIWRRGIQWSDFAWIGFLLAPAGVAAIIRSKAWSRSLVVLGPILGLAATIWGLAALGAPMPTVRLIMYLAVALAVLAGVGAAYLWRWAWGVDLRVTAIVGLVLALAVALPPVATYRKSTPFSAAQVRTARAFAVEANATDWTILTPFNEVTLLLFADVDGLVTDRELINAVMTANSRDELEQALDDVWIEGRPVYLYADKRFVRDGVTVSPDALGGSQRAFTIFTFLREANADLPLGAVPTQTWPSGPCVDVEDLGSAWLLRIERCRD